MSSTLIHVSCQAGQTALMIAAGQGHMKIVEILLEHGAECAKQSDKVIAMQHTVMTASMATYDIKYAFICMYILIVWSYGPRVCCNAKGKSRCNRGVVEARSWSQHQP
jgi:hypothetical protein